jgi:hypothetical protein
MAKLGVVDMEALARRIHEAERAAIERGWTVIILDPSRPWIAFDELPMQAQEGRRRHPARPPLCHRVEVVQITGESWRLKEAHDRSARRRVRVPRST